MGLVVTTLIVIPSCGSLPFNPFTGGGPNVAANTQVGETNSQTVGTTEVSEQTISEFTAEDVRQSNDKNKVQAESVQTVVVNEVPSWVILLLLLGWLFPSPNEIGRWIRKTIFRTKE